MSTTPALVISLSTIDQITVAKSFSMDLVSKGGGFGRGGGGSSQGFQKGKDFERVIGEGGGEGGLRSNSFSLDFASTL